MSSLDDLVIRRTTAAQQIADALSETIVSGELPPGMPLRESAFASRLNVSRNTLREAVRILEQGGLVQIEVGRGAVVRRLEAEDIADLYGVREVLELTAVRQSRDPDLAAVRAALGALGEALREGSPLATVERDLRFHASIVATLRSPRLDRFFADLCGELRFFLTVLSHVDHEVERPEDLLRQHASILEAWEDGDRRRAATLLREHIRSNAKRIDSVLHEANFAAKARSRGDQDAAG
jgi:DNA-binding GntR family transcriptional regulator